MNSTEQTYLNRIKNLVKEMKHGIVSIIVQDEKVIQINKSEQRDQMVFLLFLFVEKNSGKFREYLAFFSDLFIVTAEKVFYNIVITVRDSPVFQTLF